MVLKEWSEVWKIYKESGSRLSKAILSPRNARSYWYVWATFIGVILSSLPSFVGIGIESKEVVVLGWVVIGLTSWLARFPFRKALAKQFTVEYATHGLAQYPLLTRRRYLHYALFLQELVDQKYSSERIAELSSFADIAKPPEKPAFQLSQYPSLMVVLTAFVTLFINSMIKSPHWENVAALVLTIGLMLVGMGIAVLPILHDVVNLEKFHHQTLQRFLQWAAKDIKEAQQLKTQLLRMELPGSQGPYR